MVGLVIYNYNINNPIILNRGLLQDPPDPSEIYNAICDNRCFVYTIWSEMSVNMRSTTIGGTMTARFTGPSSGTILSNNSYVDISVSGSNIMATYVGRREYVATIKSRAYKDVDDNINNFRYNIGDIVVIFSSENGITLEGGSSSAKILRPNSVEISSGVYEYSINYIQFKIYKGMIR